MISERRFVHFASIAALASLWIWNFRQAQAYCWTQAGHYEQVDFLFSCTWNFVAASTLFLLYMLYHRSRGKGANRAIIILLFFMGTALALLGLSRTALPLGALLAVAVVVGLYYSLAFFSWLMTSSANSVAGAMFESSESLVLAALAYYALSGTGTWDHPMLPCASVCITCAGLSVKWREYYRSPQQRLPVDTTRATGVSLGGLTVFFLFSLVVQATRLVQPKIDAWTGAALCAGIMLLIASSFVVTSKTSVLIFMGVAGTMCLSLLLTMLFIDRALIVSQTISMISFWVMFILILSFPQLHGGELSTRGPKRATFLYLALFFLAFGVGRIATFVTNQFDTLCRLMVIAAMLTVLLMATSYYVGLKTGRQDGCHTPQTDKSCNELREIYGLTVREEEIMTLLISGRSIDRIARQLKLSSNTVKTHRNHLYSKLGIHDRQELIDLYIEKTLSPTESKDATLPAPYNDSACQS